VIRISWRNCGGNRILKCCHTENGDFHVYYNTSQPFVIHLLSFVIHLVTRVEKLTNWSFACKKIEMKKTMKSSISIHVMVRNHGHNFWIDVAQKINRRDYIILNLEWLSFTPTRHAGKQLENT
jgi:hypothetical protein